jgi:hypothetical protein
MAKKSLPPRKGYVSEISRMIGELLSNPEVRQNQRIGRGIFWDHPIDWEEQRRFQESSVKQRAYEYDSNLKRVRDQMPNTAPTSSEGKWR